MSDTELDLMIEMDAEKQWEEENQPAPSNPIESLSEDVRIHAYSILNTATFLLGLVLEDIGEAQDEIKDTPQGDKLAGFCDQLSDFIYDMKDIEKEIWARKGVNVSA